MLDEKFTSIAVFLLGAPFSDGYVGKSVGSFEKPLHFLFLYTQKETQNFMSLILRFFVVKMAL